MGLTIDEAMSLLHKDWRYRWCNASGGCACMGAANCSGRLSERGFTYNDWLQWTESHSRRRKDRRSGNGRRAEDNR